MSSRDSNHSTLLFSEHSVCVHANCLSDLVFPQQINDLAVSIPPRLVKLHKYFVVCSKPKPLDGVQLVQREGGLEKTGTLLLQVPWPKRSHWRTSHTVKKNSSKNIFIKDIILLCFFDTCRVRQKRLICFILKLPRGTETMTWSASIFSPSWHSTVTGFSPHSALFQWTRRTGRLYVTTSSGSSDINFWMRPSKPLQEKGTQLSISVVLHRFP